MSDVVPGWIQFKVSCLVRQWLFGQAPPCLADDCCLVSDNTLALSADSWRSDLLGAANTQQLRRPNFSSRWTSLAELSSGPATQSRHHLRTVRMTAEGTPFFGKHEHSALWLLICGALEKHLLTYLLTYLFFALPRS